MKLILKDLKLFDEPFNKLIISDGFFQGLHRLFCDYRFEMTINKNDSCTFNPITNDKGLTSIFTSKTFNTILINGQNKRTRKLTENQESIIWNKFKELNNIGVTYKLFIQEFNDDDKSIIDITDAPMFPIKSKKYPIEERNLLC